MRNNILFLILILINTTKLFSQESIGRVEIPKWGVLSASADQPQFKRIDQDRFIAYYRLSLDESGVNIYDNKLNILNSLSLKITDFKKNKVVFFQSVMDEMRAFPKFIYQKEDNSIVLFGKSKRHDKDYNIIGLSFDMDKGTQRKIDTLSIVKGELHSITISKNNSFVLVSEQINADKLVARLSLKVFNKRCLKTFDFSLDWPKKATNNAIVNDNGEVLQCFSNEIKRQISITFNKIGSTGIPQKTITFLPSKDDNYDYKFAQFVEPSDNQTYCILTKESDYLEGMTILKLDFVSGKYIVVMDKIFDKDYLKSIYQLTPSENAMTSAKKMKAVSKLEYFTISDVYTDENGFYILMESLISGYWDKYRTYFYTHEDAIVFNVNYDGKIKWGTPLKRHLQTKGDDIAGGYTDNGLGGKINGYTDDKSIKMLVPSEKKIYVVEINKLTGRYGKPKLVLDQEEYYTNYCTTLWLNSNNVIFTSMDGIFFVLNKKKLFINSVKL